MRKIETARIFEIFEEISSIPRCTGDEARIAEYVIEFAQKNGLNARQDEIGNVIVQKKGTAGYETSATVILQGHMDMLCIKEKDAVHDFSVQGPKLQRNGDLITAVDTSLGSDNGIALAFYLTLLESKDIPHPPLEVVLTVQEQAGLIGAKALDVSGLTGRYLINMDSEEEGEFIVGCAGEKRIFIEKNIEANIAEGDAELTISLSGLKGGHSGLNIHRNRGNAAQLLALLCNNLIENVEVELVSICAGEKYNVIPNYGEMVVVVPHDAVESSKQAIADFAASLDNLIGEKEFNLEFSICPVRSGRKAIEKSDARALVDLILSVPNGVLKLNSEDFSQVDTSLSIGVVHTESTNAVVKISLRSMDENSQAFYINKLRIISRLTGSELSIVNDYPAWKDEGENHLRRMFEKLYFDTFSQEPVLKTIHAGLECSILAEKLNERKLYPKIEMISFGPDIFDAHSPQEAVSISSIKRTWSFFIDILKSLKD